MPTFPKCEPDILMLAQAMLGGYQAQPGVFPHADAAGLDAARAAFLAKSAEQTEAQARALAATRAKAAALEALTQVMRTQLRQSELDTAAAPQSLDFIGWAPAGKRRASDPPGQPLRLAPSAEGAGTVTLRWKSPVSGSGGRVRAYAVERRDLAPGQPDTGWQKVGVALAPSVTLEGQPRGVQMEYRVVAVNPGGESAPSNTATVVL